MIQQTLGEQNYFICSNMLQEYKKKQLFFCFLFSYLYMYVVSFPIGPSLTDMRHACKHIQIYLRSCKYDVLFAFNNSPLIEQYSIVCRYKANSSLGLTVTKSALSIVCCVGMWTKCPCHHLAVFYAGMYCQYTHVNV